MGIHLADQTLAFFHAMLAGAALALLFDAFRISRIALPTPVWVVFLEDITFFFICAVSSFVLMLSVVEGQVRFFILVGEGLGALFYSITLGQLVMAVSKTVIHIIKSLLRLLLRWIVRPVWLIIYHILSLCLRPFRFLAGTFKKSMQRWKFRLKIRRLLVYNHFKELFAGKQSIAGEHTGNEAEVKKDKRRKKNKKPKG